MLFIYVYIAQCLLCFAVFSLHLWFGLVWLVVEEVKIIIRTILHTCARITHTHTRHKPPPPTFLFSVGQWACREKKSSTAISCMRRVRSMFSFK